jgi:hypothetical protein
VSKFEQDANDVKLLNQNHSISLQYFYCFIQYSFLTNMQPEEQTEMAKIGI